MIQKYNTRSFQRSEGIDVEFKKTYCENKGLNFKAFDNKCLNSVKDVRQYISWLEEVCDVYKIQVRLLREEGINFVK